MLSALSSNITDPDEYRAKLDPLRIQLTFQSTTGFHAHLINGRLGRLRIMRVTENLPRIGFLSFPAHSLFISFPTQAGKSQIWRGIELEAGDIVLHRTGERLHQNTTGVGHWGLIETTIEDVMVWCEIVTGHQFPSLLLGRVLRPRPPDAIRLLNLHAEAGRLFGSHSKTLAHPEVVRAIEQNMIHALVECLIASPVQKDTPAQRRWGDVMVRFEAAIASPVQPPDA